MRLFRLIAVCLAFLTGPALAQPALPNGVTKVTAVEGITEYRLGNGLKVLLFPDLSKPTITVNVTYLVGSRHENYGETGMAHLLEHLVFKGTPKNPDLDKQFNVRGARSNGSTWLDRTNYFELFQASEDNLKWAIEMEADRMVNSFIRKSDLNTEFSVVRNEYEMGENSPFQVMLKRMQSVAYDWHSYGRSTIGNRSDIENVKEENLQAFYRMYYQPDNAVLLVAGKFDEAKALALIANAFGKIPKPTRKLPEFWTLEPTQDGEREFKVRRKGDVQIVMAAYKVPSGLHPDSDGISFANFVLGDTPTGRLHKALVETGKASQVFGFPMTGFNPGLHIFGAVVKKGDAVEPVRDELVRIVEGFGAAPATAEEISRARKSYAAMATGIKRVLPDRIVFTYQGDGDLASIGMGEIMHAAGRGENITVIFINNAIYGMTGGQMAPTTLPGQKTTSSPRGRDVEMSGFPLRMAETLATMQGTGYSVRRSLHDPKNIRLAKKAIRMAFEVQKRGLGFSIVELLSTCPTNWNMTPDASLKWVEDYMVPVFPIGDYKISSALEGLKV